MGRIDLDDELFLPVVDRLWWGDLERKKEEMVKVTGPFPKIKLFCDDIGRGDQIDLIDVMEKWEARLMTQENQPDIPYNFLVGNDGIVYEGRSWEYYPPEINEFWICYLGNFTDDDPDWDRIYAVHNLILYGIKENYIEKHFSLETYTKNKIESPQPS
ncbi:peptidoglycan-recognition protein SA-like [Macrosteles quadrilineatus]|uniref:peptidoglycan-recognition protein SA-like n=1 Tax=Macrosteles quadrilineatus TaxID=74068 RepID=UPI0023E2743E|nr:peptidoglycan-recognition protein SA-like [Macrosteles quadrilineatus]